MSEEKSLPRFCEVTLDSGKVKIEKLPMGKYLQVFNGMKQIPDVVDTISSLSGENLYKEIPNLLCKSWQEMIGILSIASGLPEEKFMNEIGLEEAVDIIGAVIEVNNFFGIAGKLRNLLPQYQAMAITTKAKAPGNAAGSRK